MMKSAAYFEPRSSSAARHLDAGALELSLDVAMRVIKPVG